MKKVIALNEKENLVLTTLATAEKNNWWKTHHLSVDILPVTTSKPQTSTEPEPGNIMESGGRYYKITKSSKILICPICQEPAKFKIGFRFYCKQHYKHLMLTKPIRRINIQPGRNEPCACGSGLKYKNCCIVKSLKPIVKQ
jgi:hypothetical protein